MIAIFTRWKENREIGKRIAGKPFMNLGTNEPAWDGYVTCDLSRGEADFCLDATKPYPKPFRDHFDFVWSERMLEHIEYGEISAVLEQISIILKTEGRARFCLPVCFYGTPKINMVREGNEDNCERMGHVTWFTKDGYGPITPEVFGAASPPDEFLFWKDIVEPLGLRYVPIRHYDPDGTLFVNEEVVVSEGKHPFSDRPEVVLWRPDSLMFDLEKL